MAFLATVVLAYAAWAFANTAKVSSSPARAASNTTDYGYLANVVLANDVFPTDSLSSQLKSYVVPNTKLRSDDWQHINAAVNVSCPVRYHRLK